MHRQLKKKKSTTSPRTNITNVPTTHSFQLNPYYLLFCICVIINHYRAGPLNDVTNLS